MAIEMTFELEGTVRKVLDFQYQLTQPMDATGRPCAKFTGGIFHLILEGDRETDLYEWSIHPNQMKHCKFTRSSRFGVGKSTTIQLLDVYCTAYTEHIPLEKEAPYTYHLSLSPATMIQNGTVIFSKFWRKTDPNREKAPLTVREEDPEMIDSYYENKNGEKIPDHKIKVGDEVFLVIKTKNAIGKLITADLADNSKDFEYNGEALENDILEGISINTDVQRIKLKVVPQHKTTS